MPAPAHDFSGIEVTVTRKGPVVDGGVSDAQGKPAHGVVIYFPVDRALWRNVGRVPTRLGSVPITTAGNYHILRYAGPPAGEYYFAALADAPSRFWEDIDFLERVSGAASRISLEWGRPHRLDLRLLSGE